MPVNVSVDAVLWCGSSTNQVDTHVRSVFCTASCFCTLLLNDLLVAGCEPNKMCPLHDASTIANASCTASNMNMWTASMVRHACFIAH